MWNLFGRATEVVMRLVFASLSVIGTPAGDDGQTAKTWGVSIPQERAGPRATDVGRPASR